MKNIFSTILIKLTKKPRYKVIPGFDFQWSKSSWVHNFFRLYELIFWRRSGVRVEAELFSDSEGKNVYQFYTLEALLAHFEYRLRNLFKLPKFKFVPIRQLQYVGGIQINPIFNLAIAFDNAVEDNDASTNILTHTTANFTITGSNITLTVNAQGQAVAAQFPTAVKWGGSSGTSMSNAGADVWVSGAAVSTSLWYLDGLSTATQTVFIDYGANSQSRIGSGLISLTGCANPSLGAVNTASNTVYNTGSTVAVTTTTANSVVVSGSSFNDTTTSSASGSNQTQRYNGNVLGNHGLCGGTQTTTTTGSYTSSYTWTGVSGGWVISVMEVKPFISTAHNLGFNTNRLRPRIFGPGLAR